MKLVHSFSESNYPYSSSGAFPAPHDGADRAAQKAEIYRAIHKAGITDFQYIEDMYNMAVYFKTHRDNVDYGLAYMDFEIDTGVEMPFTYASARTNRDLDKLRKSFEKLARSQGLTEDDIFVYKDNKTKAVNVCATTIEGYLDFSRALRQTNIRESIKKQAARRQSQTQVPVQAPAPA